MLLLSGCQAVFAPDGIPGDLRPPLTGQVPAVEHAVNHVGEVATDVASAGSRSGHSVTAPVANSQVVDETNNFAAPSPPRISDFDSIQPWFMSLDDAVRIALEDSAIIRDSGGRVLTMPDSVRTSSDPALVATDPNGGLTAAQSVFDSRLETGFTWNGGGRSVGRAVSSGAFGVFSQPETLAQIGVGRTLATGSQVSIGAVGGYDETLAAGIYAAYGAELRHPLMRGSGTEINQIAGPNAQPGQYRGVSIAQINLEKSHLELEQAVLDLVQQVSHTYWELQFAYRNLQTKRAALEQARQSWEREKIRVAGQVSPFDSESLARQQFFAADAAVKNAIGGTERDSGIYDIENKLRTLLGAPISDGRLIHPTTQPLETEFPFDWHHAVQMAKSQRIEIRRQRANLKKGNLELRASHNLLKPQLDFVGTYRRLGDESGTSSDLFSQPLNGWQIGIEMQKPLGSRREHAAVHNAELRLRRAQAVLTEQARQIEGQLRIAFTELDRTYSVSQSLALSRDAANTRLQAASQRHAAGTTDIEPVLESQIRATQAGTAWQRSLVDYNHALVQLHAARGTLLETLGVGFSTNPQADEVNFAHQSPSVFTKADHTAHPAVAGHTTTVHSPARH